MKKEDLYIGQIIYHKHVYDYKEPLTIISITNKAIVIKGDLSGGTHCVEQVVELPINGISTIYNYGYKEKCRREAITIHDLSINIDRNKDNMTKTMFDLLDMVLTLTNDIDLNNKIE